MSIGGTAPSAWERSAVSFASVEELDLEALTAYIARRLPGRLPDGEPDPEQVFALAARLGLVVQSGPRTLPSVVGMLLFGRDPQLAFPQWTVAAARIDGKSLSDPVRVRLDLEGALASLLDQALDFVHTHSSALPDLASGSAAAAEYPSVAVYETVLNALVHRDLRLPGRVALRMFDDRLEVWSPGAPPTGGAIDLDALTREGGVSFPRNVLLAAHARSMGLGEQLGRGLTVARRAMAEHSHRPLSVDVQPVGVLVTLHSSLAAPTAVA